MSYGDIKPLPYTTYDVIVHLMSGIIFLTGILYIFGQFDNLKEIVNAIEITDVTVDDIFLAFMFTILSYATGHLISSFSAELLQGYLDTQLSRPFDRYFKKKEANEKEVKRKYEALAKTSRFLIYLTLSPIILYRCKFKNMIERTYYDGFVLNSEEEKKEEEKETDPNEIKRLENAVSHHWDLQNQNTDAVQEFIKGKQVFHYIESLSKSHPSHHSEFVYGHLIQYSFAHNMTFVFSVFSILLFVYTVYSLIFFTFQFCFECQIESFSRYMPFLIKCQIYHSDNIMFGSIYQCGIAIFMSIAISISFFLRFLDQYKRYTREIYLAFVTEELRK